MTLFVIFSVRLFVVIGFLNLSEFFSEYSRQLSTIIARHSSFIQFASKSSLIEFFCAYDNGSESINTLNNRAISADSSSVRLLPIILYPSAIGYLKIKVKRISLIYIVK